MPTSVYINGQILAPEEASISVFDRGFLYGESVYETVSTYEGRVFALADHIERLAQSANSLGIPMPKAGHIEAAVEATVRAASNPESRIRIILTPGGNPPAETPAAGGHSAPLAFAPVIDPVLIVIVSPLNPPAPELYENGVAVEIVSVTRNLASALDPAIKSGNYLNNVLALRQARERRPDAHEAILCAHDGSVAEGSTSNIFAVIDGQLTTPDVSVGILNGVTRRKVMGLADELSISVSTRRFGAEALRGAEEAFLTSAARGILPIAEIDGTAVKHAVPGAITKRLREAYLKRLKQEHVQ